MAQFLLIASLALGSSSAFAEEGSDSGSSSQIIVEAEESISEELKSIYQEEVDQVLAEGISYSEEERLSDFPDLDSLLAKEGAPGRVAKISTDQKVEKGKNSKSALGIQNRKSTSEILSASSALSQNCLLGLNVLLPNLKIEQGLGQEFLPRAQAQGRTRVQEVSPVRVISYTDALSGCSELSSLYFSKEGFRAEAFCSAKNPRNQHYQAGVTTIQAANSNKTAENALEVGLGSGIQQIKGIAQVSGESYENRVSPWENASKRGERRSSLVRILGESRASGFSSEKLEAHALSQTLKSSIEKDASKVGQDSHKFSSGRPTLEILT
ncbi:hypothetical protein [Leptospira andrefontaineae]|uniref:hypothetical protein n=1 Tax=Leptospira andrefontaineae TaxID=2484976 RepID=UPI001FC9142B|nr:hypothetical protein [Leptospira andrefontaineae]